MREQGPRFQEEDSSSLGTNTFSNRTMVREQGPRFQEEDSSSLGTNTFSNRTMVNRTIVREEGPRFQENENSLTFEEALESFREAMKNWKKQKEELESKGVGSKNGNCQLI